MRYRIAGITGLMLIGGLAGCATSDHNNTLVFVTSTKLALDVSASPTGTPDFTLGYKRYEGVWMPLIVNKKSNDNVTTAGCDEASNNCMYQGKEHGDNKTDTYSVLASFGAEFSGGASGGADEQSTAQGGGGLAQFFATGIAAQKLAMQDGSRLVSVQPVDKKLIEAVEKRAERAEKQEEKLRNILGEQYDVSYSEGINNSKGLGAKKLLVLQTITPSGAFDIEKWKGLVDKTELESKDDMKAWDLAKIKISLDLDQASKGRLINPLYESIEN